MVEDSGGRVSDTHRRTGGQPRGATICFGERMRHQSSSTPVAPTHLYPSFRPADFRRFSGKDCSLFTTTELQCPGPKIVGSRINKLGHLCK